MYLVRLPSDVSYLLWEEGVFWASLGYLFLQEANERISIGLLPSLGRRQCQAKVSLWSICLNTLRTLVAIVAEIFS